MKIRLGFVSNSSSTSFTIIYNLSDVVKLEANGKNVLTMTVNDFFDGIVERSSNSSGDSTEITAVGKENVRDYYKEQSRWNDENALNDFDSFVEDIKDNETVSVVKINYHDEFARKIFDMFLATGHFRALDKNGIEC